MASKQSQSADAFLDALIGGPLTFGAMVRSIREGEEESLSTFATRLGVSKANLSDIELGRRAVSPKRAAEWANTLGYSVPVFVGLALEALLRADGMAYTVQLTEPKATAPKRSKRHAA